MGGAGEMTLDSAKGNIVRSAAHISNLHVNLIFNLPSQSTVFTAETFALLQYLHYLQNFYSAKDNRALPYHILWLQNEELVKMCLKELRIRIENLGVQSPFLLISAPMMILV